jgi:hypothetical protein
MPTQAPNNINKVDKNINFLPIISERNPTGIIVEAVKTPMKKQAPKKPILYFVSHVIIAYCYQLSMSLPEA